MMVSGDITVTLMGTLKAGDEVVLWKCGSLQTTSNLLVNLPELPEGLYWDTSQFLKKEGKLKVTDTPTGIVERRMEGENDRRSGEVYDLQGRKQSAPRKGLYINNGKKIVIR